MKRMTYSIVQLIPVRRTGVRKTLAAAGLTALLLAAAAPAQAQFFPTEEPVVVFTDDFSTFTRPTDASPDTGIWNVMRWHGGNLYDGYWLPRSDFIGCAEGDTWLQHVRESIGRSYRSSVIAIDQSMMGNPGYEPDQWTNIRFEVDFRVDNEQSAMGVVLGGSSWDSPVNGYLDVEGGYLFYIDHYPTKADARDLGQRSVWHLVKRMGGVDVEIGRGPIELDPGNNDLLSVYEDQCYRLRIEFFCGNLRAQVKRFDCNSTDNCSYWDCGGEWCTIMEWTDPAASYLTPGFAGLWSSGTRSDANGLVRFDNVTVSSWGDSCHLVCGAWSAWSADFDSNPFTGLNGEEGRERFPFKKMYEGALLDYSYGTGNDGYKIDIDSLEPTDSDPRNVTTDGYCNGWNLLVDLPPPATATNVTEMQAVLEPMSSAVDLLNDGTNLVWQDDFDPDPLSATYNPIPIVTDGTTPIANSLWDAYDWYQDAITTGQWANDPLAACRQWYVVLITDGEESCGLNACDSDQAAWKFKVPDVGEPVRVFTIGFSEEFDPLNPSPLECVSTITDGTFYVAKNAADLTTALQGVIDEMDSRDRSFVPFQVTPPSSVAGSVGNNEDYLALYPFFVPRKDFSLWTGTVYAFKLNSGQPVLPSTPDCQIDFAQVEWDAATSLTNQLALGTPLRNVYMGTDSVSGWTRRDLDDVGTDSLLRDEFKARLNMPTLPTDLEAQEIVNFLTDIYDNPMGLSPAPQNPPRPTSYPVLGDIYHSQPVVVKPPNTSLFYYDYGFVGPNEAGAHDYQLFMDEHAKRRRVALVGANDGMLHAFDAGFWDRDDGGTYDDFHDLGTGTELFAYVPQAIADRLWVMTYGTEQQYMVDGHVTVGDVFISPDGSSPKEWRTVALATMRRGGRGIVALDVTQPDPTGSAPDYIPTETVMAGCADGTAGNCSAPFPKVMWEFSDQTDADANCPLGLSGDECAPYWDLGWTWSKPAIARVPVYNSSDPNAPDDVFIAFFGGGWDRQESDLTGTFVYGVDVATGAIVYKQSIGVAVPGNFTAHDSDLDGFHDRIYFGDSDSSLWRISFPAPNDSAATGIAAATLERMFDFRASFSARQKFFPRPVIVPATFDGANFTWALAVGAGDRANLDDESGDISAFFFVLDSGSYATPRTAADLLAIDYSALTGDFECSDNALDPDNGLYGWYMTMRPNEKTTFEATVINGHVLFPTFEPGLDLTASNPPDLCGTGGGGGGGGGGFGGPLPGDVDPDTVCRAAGIGRVYDLWFECGNGTTTELNDLPTGSEFYTIDGTTYVTHTLSGGSPGLTQEFINPAGYTVTNWRQE